MALKSLILPFVLLSSLVVFTVVGGVSATGDARKEATVVGGWRPITNPRDPTVVEIGEFAVTEHDKQTNEKLKFQAVVSGETQVVAGTNYRLIVSAKDGAGSGNYEAVVWDKPWEKFRKLTSFKRV